jgi:2C-methyl-D-erythritol 2,4-cyclodiphosphate synthase
LHKPDDCRLTQDSSDGKVDSLSISQALVGAIEEEDEDDDFEDPDE